MELTDFETDMNRVLDEVLAGRVDIPWLRAQIDRLDAARHRLPHAEREWAELALDQLRDYLAADELDRAWAAWNTGDHPVLRAVQIRATAGYGVTEDAARLAEFERGVDEIEVLAASVPHPQLAGAIRHEAWLLRQQITAIRGRAPRPSHRADLSPTGTEPASGRLSAPLTRRH